jgi:hypothetical protein
MKKTVCFIAAAVLAASLCMTSCGSDSSTEDSAAQAQTGASETLSASDVADKLLSDIEFTDTLNEISSDMVEKFYGISADKYSSGKVYVGSGGATAEEIACFDAVDADAAAEIKAACESRIESQIKQFENYVPAELDKLNDPVLVVSGNSVYMCLSNDNDKAKEIIG